MEPSRGEPKSLTPMSFNVLEEEFKDKAQRSMDIAMLEVCVWVAMGSFYERLAFRGFQG